MKRFFEEILRRKVLPVAAAYAIGGWVLLQVGDVLIGGEPGVGKSRLGEEALAIARNMGLLPLTGHAYEDRGVPFQPQVRHDFGLILADIGLRSAP